MTYPISTLKLFGVLVVLCVINPLVSAVKVDCTKNGPKVDPATCCRAPNLVSQDIEEKCRSLRPNATQSQNQTSGSDDDGWMTACFFNTTGIMPLPVGTKCSPTKLSAHLQKIYLGTNATMATVGMKAFVQCVPKMQKVPKVPKGTTPPNNYHILVNLKECILKAMFLTCPKTLSTDNANCTALRTYVKACPKNPFPQLN